MLSVIGMGLKCYGFFMSLGFESRGSYTSLMFLLYRYTDPVFELEKRSVDTKKIIKYILQPFNLLQPLHFNKHIYNTKNINRILQKISKCIKL